jgi:hypothetical protein
MEQNVPAKRHAVSTNANFKVFGSGAKGRLRLKNISTSGAAFKIVKNMASINKGDLIFISILHENLTETMQVYAEVIWVKEPEMGVRFLPKAEVERRYQASKIVY